MNQPCSITLLKSALTGDLPADHEADLHHHLEECQECGALLEQLAGGAAWCQEAASLLKADDLDEAASSREDWSAVDFTVDHLEPAEEPGVLGRLGGYDVLEVIGQGGMAVVLKAFDRNLKRCIAIKVLAPHLARNSLARKRFAREAQAAAAVVHANVLAIHQVQPAGRLPFLVMPLVAGESLAQRLTAQGALELKEVLRIGMQAAAGLAAAHEQGLVHRDVKPANILLEKGVERAVLTDFGLARAADDVTLTRWGVIAGTPQYMSPEQARGEALDGRSDLFSLGCVLYEMATGVSPFRTDTVLATMRRLVDDAPQAIESLNPELPRWFVGIVERLLEKDPARRFASAKEVSEILEGCLAHVQQPASVPLPAELARAPRRRGWRQAVFHFKGVMTMIALLGVALLGGFLLSADPPDIAGQWQGDDWGRVVLMRSADGDYSGTYSDTHSKQPGKIRLTWSRIERRYNGTWREGDDRFGEISVRLVDDEIRGAITTDAKSKINPATPRLADLKWTRADPGRAHDEMRPGAGNDPPPAAHGVVRTFRLRFKPASEIVDDLMGHVLHTRLGHAAKPSANDKEIVVVAPPEVMKRVQTYITVWDWQDRLVPQSDPDYPRSIAERIVRGFFHNCATEDAEKVLSNVLSPGVLAELKGDIGSQEYVNYSRGGMADPEWEKSLRADWPGKKEAIARLVREWNRFPLTQIRDNGEAAIGSRIRHFCSLSFAGAPEDSYKGTVEQEPSNPESFFFGSLPPWWKSEEKAGSAASPARQNAASGHAPADTRAPAAVTVLPLRFKLASEMADDLRSILLGRPGHNAKPSTDNQDVVVLAPRDVMKRVKTFVTVMDWPDGIGRQPNYNYPRDTVLRTARSFFYACAIEDDPEAFSKLLSPGVLAQLKGETKSAQYLDYSLGGTPDPEWEKSLRADWPGKKEAIERFVREWNRYPLKRITQESGVAIGFGVKHFCSLSFEGAPKDFYSVTIEPDRSARGTNNESFLFSLLPPWWKSDAENRTEASPAAEEKPPAAQSQTSNDECESPNGEIQGRLIDDVTGRPVQGALVGCTTYINDWHEAAQVNSSTDADGRCRLKVPSPGIYGVWLGKYEGAAHMTAIVDDGIAVEPYRVARSQLRLIRSRMLTGKLLDSDGKPVAGCGVFAASSARQAVQGSAPDGSFKFALPPGRVYLYAFERVERADAKPPDSQRFGSALLEIPSTGNIEPVTLTLSTSRGEIAADEWLKQSTPGTRIVRHTDALEITGTVVDGEGNPLPETKVFDADGPIVIANDQGEFRVACDLNAPINLHAFLSGYHVWFGRPTTGDVLKIVMEKKPAQ